MDNTEPKRGIKGFASEVKAELMKCTWPSWLELRQSTVVVILSFLLLGAFVAFSDVLLRTVLSWMF